MMKKSEEERLLSTNKLYRCPPSPPPEEKIRRERSFVLDSIPMGRVSEDYSKANPRCGSVIPTYNGQTDPKTRHYFSFHGVQRTLKKNKQKYPGDSIEGTTMERFEIYSHPARYLKIRNENGSGISDRVALGHDWYLTNVKEFSGYHGPFGYRRNTPWLRKNCSSFGFCTTSPLHI